MAGRRGTLAVLLAAAAHSAWQAAGAAIDDIPRRAAAPPRRLPSEGPGIFDVVADVVSRESDRMESDIAPSRGLVHGMKGFEAVEPPAAVPERGDETAPSREVPAAATPEHGGDAKEVFEATVQNKKTESFSAGEALSETEAVAQSALTATEGAAAEALAATEKVASEALTATEGAAAEVEQEVAAGSEALWERVESAVGKGPQKTSGQPEERGLVQGMQGFEPAAAPAEDGQQRGAQPDFASEAVGEVSSVAQSALSATEEVVAEVEAEVATDSAKAWVGFESAIGQHTTTTTATTTSTVTSTSTVTTTTKTVTTTTVTQTETTTSRTVTSTTVTSTTATSTTKTVTLTSTSTTETKTTTKTSTTTETTTVTRTGTTTTETATTTSTQTETTTTATKTSTTETTTTATWTGTTTHTTTTTGTTTTNTDTSTTQTATSTTSSTTGTATSTTWTTTSSTATSTTITQTSTTTSSSTSTAFCFEDSVQWAPLDMPGSTGTMEADEHACQQRCMSTPGCAHFSFLRATRSCHLQDRYSVRKERQGGYISGPFQCWQYLLPDAYSKSGSKTYLPHKFRCMQPGVTWGPDMDTPKVIYGERDEVVLACQDACHNTFGCKHFTVIFPNSCHFAGSGATPTQTALLSMSGPDVPTCDKEGSEYELGHTFMKKFGGTEDQVPIKQAARTTFGHALRMTAFAAGAAIVFAVAMLTLRNRGGQQRKMRTTYTKFDSRYQESLGDAEADDGILME